MQKFFTATAVLFISILTVFAQAELPDIGIQKNLAMGVVESVGPSKIVLQTKDGQIGAILLSSTSFQLLPPDNLKLSAAKPSSLSEISVGDRVLVTGKVSDDQTSISAQKVFLVRGSDLEAQAQKQRREWMMRGIAGKVSALDADAGTISVKISSVVGPDQSILLTPKEGARFLKYSETSSKYSDAVKSTFGDIEVGDNLQALGDRSEDGKGFAAEEIITGSFITLAGTVKSIDAEKNEVTVEDLSTKKEITIAVTSNSLLKEFPEQIAQRLAMFMRMRAAGGNGTGGNSGARPAGEGRGRGQGQGQGRARRGPGDINRMLNRFPTITVSDLSKGDLIAVSSPKPKVPGRVTAIKLLAGVGPFLTAKSGSGSRRGVRGSLSVPGLDAIEF